MDPPDKSLLIIFYRNPRIGAVKTRLAATVGNEKALGIFMKLSLHTKNITKPLKIDKIVYYSDFIDPMDIWTRADFLKALQDGADLGERMKNAFVDGFKRGYKSICVIGTDCYELTGEIVEHAFDALNAHEAVIGPARDGGYYLLGMRRLHAEVFTNKQWSTDSVFRETIRDFETLGLNYVKLKMLRDVDREDDLPEELKGG